MASSQAKRKGMPDAGRASNGSTGGKKPSEPSSVLDELRPGQSVELLKELHILTREGRLNQDTRRKLKQVYHLYHFIEPLLAELEQSSTPDITLADHGAGKSYRASSSTTCS